MFRISDIVDRSVSTGWNFAVAVEGVHNLEELGQKWRKLVEKGGINQFLAGKNQLTTDLGGVILIT